MLNNLTDDYVEISNSGLGVYPFSGEIVSLDKDGLFINDNNFSIRIIAPLGSPSGTSSTFEISAPRDTGEIAVRIKPYTVGTLPSGTVGDTAYVTDATAPTYLGALTGGGAVICPVFHNGTIWVSS